MAAPGTLKEAVMTEDQHMIIDRLAPRIGYLTGPLPIRPPWWAWRWRRHDRRIIQALKDAGLPALTDEGRARYYSSGPQGFEDAGGAWSRRWCAALGLSYLDAYTDEIHGGAHA